MKDNKTMKTIASNLVFLSALWGIRAYAESPVPPDHQGTKTTRVLDSRDMSTLFGQTPAYIELQGRPLGENVKADFPDQDDDEILVTDIQDFGDALPLKMMFTFEDGTTEAQQEAFFWRVKMVTATPNGYWTVKDLTRMKKLKVAFSETEPDGYQKSASGEGRLVVNTNTADKDKAVRRLLATLVYAKESAPSKKQSVREQLRASDPGILVQEVLKERLTPRVHRGENGQMTIQVGPEKFVFEKGQLKSSGVKDQETSLETEKAEEAGKDVFGFVSSSLTDGERTQQKAYLHNVMRRVMSTQQGRQLVDVLKNGNFNLGFKNLSRNEFFRYQDKTFALNADIFPLIQGEEMEKIMAAVLTVQFARENLKLNRQAGANFVTPAERIEMGSYQCVVSNLVFERALKAFGVSLPKADVFDVKTFDPEIEKLMTYEDLGDRGNLNQAKKALMTTYGIPEGVTKNISAYVKEKMGPWDVNQGVYTLYPVDWNGNPVKDTYEMRVRLEQREKGPVLVVEQGYHFSGIIDPKEYETKEVGYDSTGRLTGVHTVYRDGEETTTHYSEGPKDPKVLATGSGAVFQKPAATGAVFRQPVFEK